MGVHLSSLPQSFKRYYVCDDTFLPGLLDFSISIAWSWDSHQSNFMGVLLLKLTRASSLQAHYIINKILMLEIFVLYQFLILNMARLLLLIQGESPGQTPFLPFSCTPGHLSSLGH